MAFILRPFFFLALRAVLDDAKAIAMFAHEGGAVYFVTPPATAMPANIKICVTHALSSFSSSFNVRLIGVCRWFIIAHFLNDW